MKNGSETKAKATWKPLTSAPLHTGSSSTYENGMEGKHFNRYSFFLTINNTFKSLACLLGSGGLSREASMAKYGMNQFTLSENINKSKLINKTSVFCLNIIRY